MPIVLFLGVCALVPTLMTLLGEGKLSFPDVIASVATVALAIYAAYQQHKSNQSAVRLVEQNATNERLITQLGTLVAEGQSDVALMSLPREIRDDNSEAGVAWKRIQSKTTRAKYEQYRVEHGESRYVAEADKRIAALGEWESVDKSDPFDIHFFLRTSPFEALRKEAESEMKAAVTRSNTENRRQFWRNVGIPFHVLLPLVPLAYIAFFSAVYGVYVLAGHEIFAPYLAGCSDYINDLASRWDRSEYHDSIQLPVDWTLQHLDTILRIALAGALALAVVWTLALTIKTIALTWVLPRVTDIDNALDRENTRRHEAVL